MSPTVRAGLLFGLGGLLAFFGGMFIPIPCVNIIIAFGSLIALGWGAGYTAAKASGAGPGQGTGRGATAGAIAGVIALIGTVVALIALSSVIMNLPGVREQIAVALQQDPNTQGLNPGDVEAAAGMGFAVAGFCFGVLNFILMLLGGLFGGMMWKGTPAATYASAGGSPYGTSPTNTYGNQPGTYTPPTEGGARVYDPNDPNRPQ
jgi:hypothetical protein